MSHLARTVGRMAKNVRADRPDHRCGECGWTSTKWVGRCGECQAWGTVADISAPVVRTTAAGPVSAAAVPIGAVPVEQARAVPTGVGELDRVLGGGLVPGSVVLLAGEPGVGKSTLLLDAAARIAERGRALYVTGEESASQVRLRADRLGALREHLLLAAETDLAAVLGHIEAVQPDVLVVDSVQTIASSLVDGSPGNMSQIREVTSALIRAAKARGMATVLVGHVTKDGSVAGPRLLEHLVDVVLHFEGDRHSRLRMVRGIKNRFGSTDEVGCFDLTEEGIEELPDPSGLFLSRREKPVPGTCVTVTVEGKRPLVAEVQALVGGPSPHSSPRRTVSGLDSGRLAMLLAVLGRRTQVGLAGSDVYAATVGGVRLTEPATDLALALAIASNVINQPVPSGLVAFGEIGLAGEVRRVTGTGRRLAEAARLGFTHALVPADPGKLPAGIEAVEVRDLGSALWLAFPEVDDVTRFAPPRAIGTVFDHL